jgi:monofunctional glycosyltransferase
MMARDPTMPAEPASRARPRMRRPRVMRVLIAGLLLCASCVGVEYLLLPSTANLVGETPAESAFMRERIEQAVAAGTTLKIRHTYVPLSRISKHMQRAVVLSEDGHFWIHHGIDWEQTEDALRESWAAGRFKRGASTITQQIARNLYLSDQRSIIRKLKEWVIAKRMEEHLSKKRILELYLNFAEWGNGVFGIEAAARAYFGKGAASLDAGEAAVLTAMLPSPKKRSIARPSRRFIHRAKEVAGMLVEAHEADASIYARLNTIFGAASARNVSTDDDE